MRVCHAVIPFMRRHGRGVIINFSSTYGNGVTPENPINWVPVTYCAAKGAIRGFTAALARDIAPDIRVNALAPGPISGNWEQEWGVSPEHIDEAKAMNPMKRFGEPREIAEPSSFSRRTARATSMARCSTLKVVGSQLDESARTRSHDIPEHWPRRGT